jgi:hypothetical protein
MQQPGAPGQARLEIGWYPLEGGYAKLRGRRRRRLLAFCGFWGC